MFENFENFHFYPHDKLWKNGNCIPLPLPGLNLKKTYTPLDPADIWFWNFFIYPLHDWCIKNHYTHPTVVGTFGLRFSNRLWILVTEILACLHFLMNIFFSLYMENSGLQFRFITDFIFGFGGVLVEYFSQFCFQWWDRQTSPGIPFCFSSSNCNVNQRCRTLFLC
jgi:hypothetical protein